MTTRLEDQAIMLHQMLYQDADEAEVHRLYDRLMEACDGNGHDSFLALGSMVGTLILDMANSPDDREILLATFARVVREFWQVSLFGEV